MSDAELLQHYVQNRSTDAFSTLVQRHVDLVYSVARRQTGSATLAEDAAQSVFIELARTAHRIKAGTPLVAWLHVVSRRIGLNTRRDAACRRAHEIAAATDAAMKPDSAPPAWTEIEPLLDEAVESLPEPDRAAILLRFFENKSFRDVGTALGTSDDAAQKRVTRALDHLRAFFGRRGLTTSAAALATTLSTHAVQPAPALLAATIASSAALIVTAIPSATSVGLKQLLALATRKTLATAVCAAALAAAVYETVVVVNLRGEIRAGEQNLDRLAATARLAGVDADAALRELWRSFPSGFGPPNRFTSGSDDALTAEITAWLDRASGLRQALADRPELRIPELQLLTNENWMAAAQQIHSASLDSISGRTEIDFTPNLASLRRTAQRNLIEATYGAVQKFRLQHGGALPEDLDQLVPFFPAPFDPVIFSRYDVVSENGRLAVAEKPDGAINPAQLAYFEYRVKPPLPVATKSITESPLQRIVREGAQHFADAHGGTRATKPEELIPHLAQPMSPAQLAEVFAQLSFIPGDAPASSP